MTTEALESHIIEPGTPVSILFVDDEVRVLHSLKRALADEPVTVFTATSGQEALRIIEVEHIDVIISDECMPGMNGSELLARVRGSHPEICRIILTGHADISSAMRAINEGRIYQFLLKPVAAEELVATIRKALLERQQETKMLAMSQRAGMVCSFELTAGPDGPTRVKWSENARSMLGLPPDVPLDSLDILYDRLHPDDGENVIKVTNSSLREPVCPMAEFRIRTGLDSYRWISQTSDMSISPDQKTVRMLSVLKDITESKQQNDRLEFQAFHDTLTGLGNRALLLDNLERALSGKNKGFVALLFIDVDNFKIINDSMGHTFGDWLLKSLSQRLAGLAPKGAVIARFGGDEFALILTGQDQEGALATAETIHAAMEQPFRHWDYEVHITVSIGIAIDGGSATNPMDMLREADTAMYTAKSREKGSTTIFDRSMHEQASERFVLVGDMHQGLARDEFFLAFQPVVDLKTLQVAGYEALARWNHPGRGLVMPSIFIPLAEESGLIPRLGLMVMEKAFHQASLWSGAPSPPFISFNISVFQLRQTDLVAHIREGLARHDINPELIKVEITESGLMDDAPLALRILNELKELGIRLQIDDFGTGYSSLRYLQRIPADSLKVDRSFVQDMERVEENHAIVRNIVDLARSLKLSIVAEGIETREELAMLRELGCEFGQGFLLDKPLPAEQITGPRSYEHLMA